MLVSIRVDAVPKQLLPACDGLSLCPRTSCLAPYDGSLAARCYLCMHIFVQPFGGARSMCSAFGMQQCSRCSSYWLHIMRSHCLQPRLVKVATLRSACCLESIMVHKTWMASAYGSVIRLNPQYLEVSKGPGGSCSARGMICLQPLPGLIILCTSGCTWAVALEVPALARSPRLEGWMLRDVQLH